MTVVYQPHAVQRGPVAGFDYVVEFGFIAGGMDTTEALWDTALWDAPDSGWDYSLEVPLFDATCFASSVNISQGRDLPLERFRPASAQIVVYDPSGMFTPWAHLDADASTGTPRVGMAVVVSVVGPDGTKYPRFTGTVDAIKDAFPEMGLQHTVTFSGVDHLSILAAYQGVEQPPVGAGELPGARLQRIFTMAEYRGPVALEPGVTQLQATTFKANALDESGLVADTETGALWADREGTVVFYERDSMLTNPLFTTVQAIFGEEEPEICYSNIELVSDAAKIKNVVTIANVGGEPTTLRDQQSVDLYRLRTYNRTDLIHFDPAVSQQIAQRHLDLYAYAANRIESLTVDMQALTREQRELVLALDLLHRIEVRRRADGFQVIVELQIQGIAERCDSEVWTLTFKTFAATESTTVAQWDIDKWDDGLWGF